MRKGLLSVIIPAYNEERIIAKAAETISCLLGEQQIDYEIIFVDDGSKDNTWLEIRKQAEKNGRIGGVSFSRNFGKESAIYAGLEHALGDCCVVIDCDLQHPPEKILDMYAKWQEGFEVVEGVKADRGKENVLHGIAASIFYKIISSAVHIDMSRASDFKLLDRKVVNILINMKESHAFFRALSSWVGFKSCQIEYEVREREEGISKWSTWSLIKYAVKNITSFSSKPLHIVTLCGLITLILSVVLGIHTLYQKLSGGALEGFTTVILLQLFFSSILMLSLGIIGYYLANIYDEIKGRPRYIIEKEITAESRKMLC